MKKEEFRSPPREYAVTPYWAWNDDLQEEEVVRQIGEMDDTGWGGFFMHARNGMVTPFLGEKWMSCVKAAVDEAAKRGMGAWVYDEHFTPSGFGGGLVPAKGPDYRQKVLVCRPYHQPMHLAEEVRCFAAQTEDGRPVSLEDITGGKDYQGSADQFLHFYVWTEPLGNPEWYQGFSYVDTMEPKVTEAFIEAVYESHRQVVGDQFGKAVPGFFSDMASYSIHTLSPLPRPCVPWTPRLPDYFERRNGYDLLEHLPSLFYDLGDYHKVRCDYWATVAEMFRENFFKRLYEWCEEHGVLFSGHVNGEETLHWQIQWSGPTMALLEYFHLPAVDYFMAQIYDPQGMKQADSVASQLGRPRCGVETYAMTGPAFSFEDRKWIGDWEYVLGANFLISYIPAYSLRGMRKHDEPPTIFFQQPWWYQNQLIDDYFWRLSYALSQGERVVDILVLQPIASVSALHRAGPTGTMAIRMPGLPDWMDPFEGTTPDALEMSNAFSRLSEDLLKIHRDYHYGDETLLAKYGAVEEGKLRIGKQNYSVVIVPGSLTWSRRTVELFQEFVAAGGQIIAIEPLPSKIDCVPAESVLPQGITVIEQDTKALGEALDAVLPTDVELELQDIWYLHRRDENQEIYFLANISRTDAYAVKVKLHTVGAVEEWDPVTGEVRPVASTVEGGYSRVSLWFPPVGSRLLVVNTEEQPFQAPEGTAEVLGRLELGSEWKLERLDPNVLVLDYCQLKVAGSDWRARSPVYAQSRFVQGAGVGVPYSIRFTFDVKQKPQGEILLILEEPERFEIQVNDQAVEYHDIGWWVDTAFKKLAITPLVKEGKNTITLSATSRPKRRYSVHDSEFEPCYVIGDFGVDKEDGFAITSEPGSFSGGSLTERGYPFYVGRVLISQEVEIPQVEGWAFLQLDGLQAVVAEVRVNGKGAGRVAWKPHTVEVTGLLKKGKNQVEIELVNSLYNLLGPHHNPMGVVEGFVYHMHYDSTLGWTDDYNLEPFGLEGCRLTWGKGPKIDEYIEIEEKTMAEEKTAKQLIEAMPEGFRPENAKEDHAVIQYKLSGEGGGNWYVTIDHGTCTVAEGVSDDASVTMMMEASDFVDLATGKLDGMAAIMSGKLKTSGDTGILMKMQAWFES